MLSTSVRQVDWGWGWVYWTFEMKVGFMTTTYRICTPSDYESDQSVHTCRFYPMVSPHNLDITPKSVCISRWDANRTCKKNKTRLSYYRWCPCKWSLVKSMVIGSLGLSLFPLTTNTSPLKNHALEDKLFLVKRSLLRGHVDFRGCDMCHVCEKVTSERDPWCAKYIKYYQSLRFWDWNSKFFGFEGTFVSDLFLVNKTLIFQFPLYIYKSPNWKWFRTQLMIVADFQLDVFFGRS